MDDTSKFSKTRALFSRHPERSMTDVDQQHLPDQTRDFHDHDGTRWSARIRQGGGDAGVDGGPPTAVVLFRALSGERSDEVSAASDGDGGDWDLSSYSDERMRHLLAQARAHGNGPSTD
jgi:hypothetical protein